MKKYQEIENIIGDIWYQNPRWSSTYSGCFNEGCPETARGGRECRKCLQKQLSALTSEEFAADFYQALADVRKCEHRLVYGEHETNNEKR